MAFQRDHLVTLATDLLRDLPALTAAVLASRLGVERHTLQRALKAAGLSFARLKQATVLDRLQRHCLANTAPEALKQVWAAMGFTSASSFARYVRRSTGMSPTRVCAELRLHHFAHKSSRLRLDAASRARRR